jgi:hypothetical protein
MQITDKTMCSTGVLVSICVVLVIYFGAAPQALAEVLGTARNGLLQIPTNESLAGCPSHCGHVQFSYPFGIGPNCFRQGFELNCDYTAHPPRLFLRNSTTQVTSIYVGYNIVYASVVGFNVTMSQGVDTYNMSWKTPEEGVIISEENDGLYVVGCDLDVYMFGNNWTDLIGSCMSICADDGTMDRAANDGGSCSVGLAAVPSSR